MGNHQQQQIKSKQRQETETEIDMVKLSSAPSTNNNVIYKCMAMTTQCYHPDGLTDHEVNNSSNYPCITQSTTEIIEKQAKRRKRKQSPLQISDLTLGTDNASHTIENGSRRMLTKNERLFSQPYFTNSIGEKTQSRL